MAEFCLECFKKLIADANDFPIISTGASLCEGCGLIKPIVLSTVSKPLRVLFLDYDGVVNTPMWNEDGSKCRYNLPTDGKVNNFQAVQWVSEFCLKHGYHIVVTSTWRLDDNYRECLINCGLRKGIEILGRTKSLDGKCRGDEIKLYLKNHPEIERYIIVDDEDDILEEQRPFFVETDSYFGFGLADSNKCERIHKKKHEGSFTAFLYNKNGLNTEDFATYDSKESAIQFAKSRDWDEVVNDTSGEIVWKR